MNRLSVLALAVWAVATSFSTLAADITRGAATKSAPAPKKVLSIEGVTEYRLSNGLQILLYPDNSSTTVTVNMTYKVGSRFESYGETGMAHLLEHMNFKGTPRHPKIPDELTLHGARANATTAEDRTNYFETFPATPSNVEWALGLEADRMVHSLIAKKDLDSEMTVVRNEFERGESIPGDILSERVLHAAFLWHNYGHPTIGARADIENVPIERLQAFYHTYYQPDNAVLIVTGKFDEETTLGVIQRAFGVIPKPTRVLPGLYTEEPTQDGEREVTLRRTGGEKVLIESYHIPADGQADSAVLALLADMLNDPASGRLYKQLIETKLAVRATAEAAAKHDAGYLMFTVELSKEGDLAAARLALNKLIDGLATEPFSAAELTRAQAQEINGFEHTMSTSAQVAMVLSDNVGVGDWRLLFWNRDQAKKVSLADLQRVAGTYLVVSNLTVGTFIPDEHPVRAAIPQRPDLTAMLQGFTGQKAMDEGEQFEASPANLEAHTHRSRIGGLQVGFLEKKTRGDLVHAVLNLHFGEVQSLRDLGEVGKFTAEMLKRGTEKHTRRQLEDELTRLKATLGIQGTADGVKAVLETTRENLEEALRLTAEVLQRPTFAQDQLEEIKEQHLAAIDRARTDPQPLAGQAMASHLSPYGAEDFRHVPTFDEDAAAVGKLTRADLERFHKQFYGASHGELAVVGSVDSVAVTRALEESFGSWKSASPYQRAAGVYKSVTAKTETLATPDMANAVFLSGGTVNLNSDDAQYPALTVGTVILGGGFMNSRLAMRLRQHDGASYSVGLNLKVDALDPVGSFTVFAICAPQNMVKVETGIAEEIARALQSGFTPEEIAAAKSGILQGRLVARSTDAGLANFLADRLYQGRDWTWDAQFEQRIATVTSEAINTAMRRYIDIKAMYTVKAGDFSKAKD
jgi:zinc protease